MQFQECGKTCSNDKHNYEDLSEELELYIP